MSLIAYKVPLDVLEEITDLIEKSVESKRNNKVISDKLNKRNKNMLRLLKDNYEVINDRKQRKAS